MTLTGAMNTLVGDWIAGGVGLLNWNVGQLVTIWIIILVVSIIITAVFKFARLWSSRR